VAVAVSAAVQIFNNPQVQFKSELFITTAVVAWTYLLHAYYRGKHIDYRQWRERNHRLRIARTTRGAVRYWSLEECLASPDSPIDEISKKNLMFLIGIRHEIEHQMTLRIDDTLGAKFQAAALNFNGYIKKLFGVEHGLDVEQAFSIQFSGISEANAKNLMSVDDLPRHLRGYIQDFHSGMTDDEFNDPRFAYRIAFVRKTSNSKTLADKVIEFVPADSAVGEELNRVFLKETERTKYRPKNVVAKMQAEGFTKFIMHSHTELWKSLNAKDPRKGFGADVAGTWFWYESWISEVRRYCEAHREQFE